MDKDKVKVNITNKQKAEKIPTGIRMLIRRACVAVLKLEEFHENAEVEVSFVDDEQIRQLNRDFRNIDSSTDVLSFPMYDFEGEDEPPLNPDGSVTLGDIVISVERAAEQAEELGHGFLREVAFLTIHSVLHLLGYDHELSSEEEEKQCERQREILEILAPDETL